MKQPVQVTAKIFNFVAPSDKAAEKILDAIEDVMKKHRVWRWYIDYKYEDAGERV